MHPALSINLFNQKKKNLWGEKYHYSHLMDEEIEALED